MVAHREVSLAAAPDGHVAVGAPVRGRGMRLDVALMYCLGLELSLDHDVGLRETGFDVSQTELESVGHVRPLCTVAPAARSARGAVQGQETLVQDRRIVSHGVLDAQDVGQDFVVHVDQVQRLLRGPGIGGGHGGDHVTLVEGLLTGDDIAAVEAVVDHRSLGLVGELSGDLRHVGRGHHRLDSGQVERAAAVYRLNPCVGVGTAEQLAVKHGRKVDVRAVPSPPGHLVRPVGPHGARPHDVVLLSR